MDRPIRCVVEQFEGVRLARVNIFEVVLDHVLEPATARNSFCHCVARVGIPEIKTGQPLRAVLVAVGDFI